jgi:hypothetical protein
LPLAASRPTHPKPRAASEKMIQAYFNDKRRKSASHRVQTKEEWEKAKPELRRHHWKCSAFGRCRTD